MIRAIKERRSVRNFLSKKISESDLKEIIECGICAPSAGNLQPWEFILIREQQRKDALAEAAYNQDFIAEAPIVIVILANLLRSARGYGLRGIELYCIQDTSAAIQNMLLAAHNLGLGACWISAFDEDAVADIVKSGSNTRPIAIMPLGHPSFLPHATPRRNLSEVLHEELYQE